MPNPFDCDRRLGDIRGDNHLPPVIRPQRLVLLGRREVRVQRVHRHSATETAASFHGPSNLVGSRHEDQHIAFGLALEQSSQRLGRQIPHWRRTALLPLPDGRLAAGGAAGGAIPDLHRIHAAVRLD